jgi:NADPH2 dehydrogenase
MRMTDPVPTFSYIIKELAKRHTDLAYVHFVEPRISGAVDADYPHDSNPAKVRKAFLLGTKPY